MLAKPGLNSNAIATEGAFPPVGFVTMIKTVKMDRMKLIALVQYITLFIFQLKLTDDTTIIFCSSHMQS